MDLNNMEPGGPEVPSDLRDAIAEFGLRFPHCPKPALLQAAQSDVLPAKVRDIVREHMGACAACTLLARDLFQLDEAPLPAEEKEKIWGRIRTGIAAEQPVKTAPPRPGWRALLFRPVPVAALAAAAILAVVGTRLVQHSQRPTAAVSQAGQPQAAAPSPSTAFRLDKAPVMLPASALLVWRGEAEARPAGLGNAQSKELREALIPYAADQYAEAAQRLENLTKKYPRLAEAHFYLGVCRLFLGHDDEAVASLKAASGLTYPVLSDAADWYLALAYHRIGRNGEARPLLEKLCHSAGKNSEQACAGLKERPVVQ